MLQVCVVVHPCIRACVWTATATAPAPVESCMAPWSLPLCLPCVYQAHPWLQRDGDLSWKALEGTEPGTIRVTDQEIFSAVTPMLNLKSITMLKVLHCLCKQDMGGSGHYAEVALHCIVTALWCHYPVVSHPVVSPHCGVTNSTTPIRMQNGSGWWRRCAVDKHPCESMW